jgi:phage head maturation protease
VERWIGSEYLLHGEKNADLTRLTTVGAAVYGHRYDLENIIGPIKEARIDKDSRRGFAVISFDDDDTGNRAWAKVKSGSLRGVSFGYAIKEAVRIEEDEKWVDPESMREFKGPALVATRWEAYEISLTPVPADASVGVGRAARDLDGIRMLTATREKGEIEMDEKDVKRLIDEAVEGLRGTIPTAEAIASQVQAVLAEANRPTLRVTPELLQDLTGRAAAVSLQVKSEVMDMALSGKTEADMLRHIAEAAMRGSDTRDHGDTQNPGAPAGNPTVPKLSEVDDDLLARSLKNPIELPY